MAINVLVVDDSAFMRKMVSDMINSDPRLHVIGTARDGLDALEKVRELPVDVITLDVNMPRMDGLEFLERLMAEKPLPVVMLSSLTQEGSDIAMEALALGAVDIVAKPSGAISLDIEKVKDDLLRKVRTAARARLQVRPSRARSKPSVGPGGTGDGGTRDVGARDVGRRDWRSPAAEDGRREPRFAGWGRRADAPGHARASVPDEEEGGTAGGPAGGPATNAPGRRIFRAVRPAFRGHLYSDAGMPPKRPLGGTPRVLVAIGASTGGPTAVEEVLCGLPPDLDVGIVITQHMQAGFTLSFANRLNSRCAFTVKEADHGDALRTGLALVAPGDYHMVVTPGHRVALNQDPPVHYVRPAVDVMMISAAEVYGPRIVGVILTGMGRDGSGGMAAIKKAGGRTIVQDEETSVIFSMPNAVIVAGYADEVVPLPKVAERIAFHSMELMKLP